MESICSDYVIKKYETIKTENRFYSVMEFANGGTLEDLMKFRPRLTERET